MSAVFRPTGPDTISLTQPTGTRKRNEQLPTKPCRRAVAHDNNTCTQVTRRVADERAIRAQYEGSFVLTSPQKIAGVRAFARRAYEDYVLKAPQPSHLKALIRLNILNAVYRNATTLGIPTEGLCRDEFISPLSCHGPKLQSTMVTLDLCPKNLLPTDLQRRVAHHPWIDLFPWPRLRDNILMGVVAGLIDEDELCCDIIEVRNENPCLIVWGEPGDVQSWEVSESFLRKWGFLIHGCPEILEVTNNWRGKRGAQSIASPCVEELAPQDGG